MTKIVPRLVALLLVSCLAGDPVAACTFQNPLSPTPKRVVAGGGRGEEGIFASQALALARAAEPDPNPLSSAANIVIPLEGAEALENLNPPAAQVADETEIRRVAYLRRLLQLSDDSRPELRGEGQRAQQERARQEKASSELTRYIRRVDFPLFHRIICDPESTVRTFDDLQARLPAILAKRVVDDLRQKNIPMLPVAETNGESAATSTVAKTGQPPRVELRQDSQVAQVIKNLPALHLKEGTITWTIVEYIRRHQTEGIDRGDIAAALNLTRDRVTAYIYKILHSKNIAPRPAKAAAQRVSLPEPRNFEIIRTEHGVRQVVRLRYLSLKQLLAGLSCEEQASVVNSVTNWKVAERSQRTMAQRLPIIRETVKSGTVSDLSATLRLAVDDEGRVAAMLTYMPQNLLKLSNLILPLPEPGFQEPGLVRLGMRRAGLLEMGSEWSKLRDPVVLLEDVDEAGQFKDVRMKEIGAMVDEYVYAIHRAKQAPDQAPATAGFEETAKEVMLTVSDATGRLKLSETTLNRLIQAGLVHPVWNEASEGTVEGVSAAEMDRLTQLVASLPGVKERFFRTEWNIPAIAGCLAKPTTKAYALLLEQLSWLAHLEAGEVFQEDVSQWLRGLAAKGAVSELRQRFVNLQALAPLIARFPHSAELSHEALAFGDSLFCRIIKGRIKMGLARPSNEFVKFDAPAWNLMNMANWLIDPILKGRAVLKGEGTDALDTGSWIVDPQPEHGIGVVTEYRSRIGVYVKVQYSPQGVALDVPIKDFDDGPLRQRKPFELSPAWELRQANAFFATLLAQTRQDDAAPPSGPSSVPAAPPAASQNRSDVRKAELRATRPLAPFALPRVDAHPVPYEMAGKDLAGASEVSKLRARLFPLFERWGLEIFPREFGVFENDLAQLRNRGVVRRSLFLTMQNMLPYLESMVSPRERTQSWRAMLQEYSHHKTILRVLELVFGKKHLSEMRKSRGIFLTDEIHALEEIFWRFENEGPGKVLKDLQSGSKKRASETRKASAAKTALPQRDQTSLFELPLTPMQVRNALATHSFEEIKRPDGGIIGAEYRVLHSAEAGFVIKIRRTPEETRGILQGWRPAGMSDREFERWVSKLEIGKNIREGQAEKALSQSASVFHERVLRDVEYMDGNHLQRAPLILVQKKAGEMLWEALKRLHSEGQKEQIRELLNAVLTAIQEDIWGCRAFSKDTGFPAGWGVERSPNGKLTPGILDLGWCVTDPALIGRPGDFDYLLGRRFWDSLWVLHNASEPLSIPALTDMDTAKWFHGRLLEVFTVENLNAHWGKKPKPLSRRRSAGGSA